MQGDPMLRNAEIIKAMRIGSKEIYLTIM